MYKRISHNITEEHFDHPAVLPKALYISSNIISPGTNGSLSINDALPQYAMTEQTMGFRMDSRSHWAKFAWGLLNYCVGLTNGITEIEAVGERLLRSAVAIGDMAKPYYGLTSGNEIGRLLASIAQDGIDMVKAAHSKQPYTAMQESMTKHIAETAKYLHELNPNNWPEPLMTEYLTNLGTYWTEYVVAKLAKDFMSSEDAIQKIDKLAVTGVDTYGTTRNTSIADIFSRGIVAQFPSMFAGA